MIKKTSATKKRIAFKYYAPTATTVCLAGDFNQWDPEVRFLKMDSKGWWKTTVTLEEATYEYRFVVDGEWHNDPRTSEERDNGLGSKNSVLCV